MYCLNQFIKNRPKPLKVCMGILDGDNYTQNYVSNEYVVELIKKADNNVFPSQLSLYSYLHFVTELDYFHF